MDRPRETQGQGARERQEGGGSEGERMGQAERDVQTQQEGSSEDVNGDDSHSHEMTSDRLEGSWRKRGARVP